MESRNLQGMLISRSCATLLCEPCQGGNTAALSRSFHVTRGSLEGVNCGGNVCCDGSKRGARIFSVLSYGATETENCSHVVAEKPRKRRIFGWSGTVYTREIRKIEAYHDSGHCTTHVGHNIQKHTAGPGQQGPFF